MAKPNLAKIHCIIEFNGFVRKKEGRYPYYLYSEKTGPMFLNTDWGQGLIIAHMQEIEANKTTTEPVKESGEVPGQDEPGAGENPGGKKQFLEGWL